VETALQVVAVVVLHQGFFRDLGFLGNQFEEGYRLETFEGDLGY
jgi:hypothetical protein